MNLVAMLPKLPEALQTLAPTLGPGVVIVLLAAIYVVGFGRWDGVIPPVHVALARRRDRAVAVQGPPIERVAADIRRLRARVATDSRSSATRQLGSRLAYDQLLVQACAMLSISQTLDSTSPGTTDHDIERFRVEAELEGAGLVLTLTPRSSCAA